MADLKKKQGQGIWLLGFALVPFIMFFLLVSVVAQGANELWCWAFGHDWNHYWSACERCGRHSRRKGRTHG